MSKFLDGKVAIVTGSGQGIGRAIAKGLAAAGAKVITNNRMPGMTKTHQLTQEAHDSLSPESAKTLKNRYEELRGDAQTTADEIISKGGTAAPFFGDIGDFNTAKSLVDFTIKTYGTIDIVANVAGAFGFGSITEITEEDWDRVNTVKPKGYFNVIHHAAPYLIEKKWGRIINCTSRSSLGDWILHPEYCAANAGVVGLTKAAAIELYPYNITCNAFEPFARTRAGAELDAGVNMATAGNKIAMPGLKLPTYDIMPPPDGIAPFICYLASEKAAHISGAMFGVSANSVSLYSDAAVKANITKYSPDFWTQEELEQAVPRNLLNGYLSIADPHNIH